MMVSQRWLRRGSSFLSTAVIFSLSLTPPVFAIPLGDPLKALSQLQSSAYAQETSSKQEIEEGLERGAKLYREGKWNEAIDEWEKVLKLDPKNETAKRYIERARKKIETRLEPKKEAVAPAAPEAAPKKEEEIQELLKQGVDLYREGKYSEAIQLWNKVLVKDPQNERAQRYIERALKKQAEIAVPPVAEEEPEEKKVPEVSPAPPTEVPPTEAVPTEVPPTKVEPTEVPPAVAKSITALKAESFLEQGKEFYRVGKFELAIETWKKALELDPTNVTIQRYIERAQEKIKEAEPAKIAPAPPPTVPTAPAAPSVPAPIPAAPAELVPAPAAEKAPAPSRPPLLPTPTAAGEIHDYGVLNLQQCILLALANYGPAKVSREEVKLAKMRLIEARRAAYPSVNLKNGITEGTSTDEAFKGLEFTAEFQMPIMSGGRIRNSIRQAEANLAVAIRNYEKIRADYVAEVEQAYYAYSNSKKYYRDRIDLLKEGTKALDMTRKQYEHGLARQLDLLNVESQFSEIEFQITSAEKDIQLAFLTLKQLMNLQDNETFDIEELRTYTVISVDYETIVKIAIDRRPDIRLAELQVLFNKYAVKVAEAKNRFKVDMNASVGLNDQYFVESDKLDLQTEFFVGIKATKPLGMHTIDDNFIIQDKVPAAGQTTSSAFGSNTVSIALFNNTAKTGITEAKIGYYRAKEEYEKGKKTTRFEVQQNFFEYQKGLAQLEGAIIRQKLGEEEVKILKAQAELNQAQIIDVLRAQVRYYDARANYGQAVTSYYTAMANLNKAIGIIAYFNPVTGEMSEAFHRTLAKPINKPKFRFCTQLTKDKPEEDILTFPPDKVTAETLLEKERRRTKAIEGPFTPVGLLPFGTEIFTPNDTKNKYLNNYYLPPEKPLLPMKPWQVLRYPALGLFEYENVVDPEEGYGEKPAANSPEAKSSSKKTQKKKITQSKDSQPAQINAVKVLEDKELVRVKLETKGLPTLAVYELADPARLLFVLDPPGIASTELSCAVEEACVVQAVRFNQSEDFRVNGFVVDLRQSVPYRVLTAKDGVEILIAKPEVK